MGLTSQPLLHRVSKLHVLSFTGVCFIEMPRGCARRNGANYRYQPTNQCHNGINDMTTPYSGHIWRVKTITTRLSHNDTTFVLIHLAPYLLSCWFLWRDLHNVIVVWIREDGLLASLLLWTVWRRRLARRFRFRRCFTLCWRRGLRFCEVE